MEGWIKLYRKFSEWEWFNISEMVHLFIYLLLNANHEDGKWRGIEIKRGQILTGLNSLHENTGISIRTLRTCLDRLQNTKEIDKQTTNKYSIITICNYENYQFNGIITDKQLDKQPTSNRQATDKQPTTNKNKENKENEKNIIPPPLDFVVDYCKKRENKIDPQYFIDWNEARGWMLNGRKMKDWQAAIRTWEQRDKNKLQTADTPKFVQ
jgi:uncharacterized membrane protein YcgQ (UPF0703/DUF1980 family)